MSSVYMPDILGELREIKIILRKIESKL